MWCMLFIYCSGASVGFQPMAYQRPLLLLCRRVQMTSKMCGVLDHAGLLILILDL